MRYFSIITKLIDMDSDDSLCDFNNVFDIDTDNEDSIMGV